MKTSLYIFCTSPKLFILSTVLLVLSSISSVVYNELPESTKEFSCGGGPFSFFMASLISTSCNRDIIHQCCEQHDRCYDARHLNQTFCDQVFCNCLSRIDSSPYCDNIAHPSLCLATEVFGHMFHWTAYENSTSDMEEIALEANKLNYEKEESISRRPVQQHHKSDQLFVNNNDNHTGRQNIENN